MLLILLLIEEEKTTIVEVETDAHALVLQDARPAAAGLPIAVDALHDEQGSICGPADQGQDLLLHVLPVGHDSQREGALPHLGERHSGAPSMEVGTFGLRDIAHQQSYVGLLVVGDTEIEFTDPPFPFRKMRKQGTEVVVGVVGIVLIDDIADEAVGPRRLDAEATAVLRTAHPQHATSQSRQHCHGF